MTINYYSIRSSLQARVHNITLTTIYYELLLQVIEVTVESLLVYVKSKVFYDLFATVLLARINSNKAGVFRTNSTENLMSS